MIGKKYENEGIAKNGAKLVTAVASAKVALLLTKSVDLFRFPKSPWWLLAPMALEITECVAVHTIHDLCLLGLTAAQL
jgi:hypothetical protein